MSTKQHITGIVVEYNPFHNGHRYHLQKAREQTQADVLIAVMSPHFVQRGEPALIHKWQRVDMALQSGVDLVLELPTPFVLQAADIFAEAALTILAKVGVTDLVFGSETADLNALKTPDFDQEYFRQGHSYASSMQTQLHPNDILGAQYLKACERFKIIPHMLKRTNRYHDEIMTEDIASATAIRHAIKNNEPFSHTTPMLLQNSVYHDLTDFDQVLCYKLTTANPEHLRQLLLVDEGIENLFKKHRDLPILDLITTCTSKRYTRSRIQRTLMNIILDQPRIAVAEIKQVRVLGMNATGQAYLKTLKNDVDIITSLKNYQFKDQEARATALYALNKPQAYRNFLNQRELEGPVKI